MNWAKARLTGRRTIDVREEGREVAREARQGAREAAQAAEGAAVSKPPREPAPKDSRFGWLRSKFYDGTPDHPIRKAQGPSVRKTPGPSIEAVRCGSTHGEYTTARE